MSNLDFLDTGDVLLFSGDQTVSRCIEYFTGSKFSHVGMVLRDPTYIHPNLKGLYLWESGAEPLTDAEDGEYVYGVQIVSLEKALQEYKRGRVYYRKLSISGELDVERLKETHAKIHHHSYNLCPFDWIKADEYLNEGKVEDKIVDRETPKCVWCSALLGFIYVRMGWLNNDILFKYLAPEEWTSKYDAKMKYNCVLDVEKVLDF